MAESFGERLRSLRVAGRYSRRELAEASGVGEGAIRDYEKSKRSPSLEAAARLAYALHKPLTVWGDCFDLADAYRLPSRDPRAGALDFGSHKGKLLSEVPYSYLEWLVREQVTRLTPQQSIEARRLLMDRRREEEEAARFAESHSRRAQAEAEKLEAEERLAKAKETDRRRQETLKGTDKPPSTKKGASVRLDDSLPWERDDPPSDSPKEPSP